MSLLKKCVEYSVSDMPKLPLVAVDSTLQPQPKVVLDSRTVQKECYHSMDALVENETKENKWRFLCSYPFFCP